MDAVEKRCLFFVNRLDETRYRWVAAMHAHAALAAPVLVSGEAVGAITFLKSAPDTDFDDDDVAKVTILAAQLGTALEALRLNQLSREEHRRASILIEVATALHGLPDTAAVMESIADRLRVLLHSPAVLVLLQQEKLVQLQAVSTEGPALALSIRSRFQQNDDPSPLESPPLPSAAGQRTTASIHP